MAIRVRLAQPAGGPEGGRPEQGLNMPINLAVFRWDEEHGDPARWRQLQGVPRLPVAALQVSPHIEYERPTVVSRTVARGADLDTGERREAGSRRLAALALPRRTNTLLAAGTSVRRSMVIE